MHINAVFARAFSGFAGRTSPRCSVIGQLAGDSTRWGIASVFVPGWGPNLVSTMELFGLFS
jgi:hypothetical protein